MAIEELITSITNAAVVPETVAPMREKGWHIDDDAVRALPAEKLEEYLRSLGAAAVSSDNTDEGISAALEAAGDGPVVAFGSLYMAGELRDRFLPAMKRHQRKLGIAARDALPAEAREKKSRAIAERILASGEFKRASVVMSYRAVKGEVSMEYFNAEAERLGKRVVYPRCLEGMAMAALRPRSDAAWRRGTLGIMEPLPELSEEVPPEDIDLVLCPCAAFDAEGRRLGMGGGYYDRYLPRCRKAHVAAVAFEAQRLPLAAADCRDIRMERVFTEGDTQPAP